MELGRRRGCWRAMYIWWRAGKICGGPKTSASTELSCLAPGQALEMGAFPSDRSAALRWADVAARCWYRSRAASVCGICVSADRACPPEPFLRLEGNLDRSGNVG